MKASDQMEEMFGVLSDSHRMATEVSLIAPVSVLAAKERGGDISLLMKAIANAVWSETQEGAEAFAKTIFILYSLGFADGIEKGKGE